MAASLSHRLFVLVIFILLLVLLTGEIKVAESRLCQRRSKTWTGFCGSSSNCDNQCKSWEHASHGACHAQFPGFACFCYFNC
ncbi:hypothetical protein BUALT_Bualt01G0029900 [Buddleja alternifolia]|uniref:Knottins-like domain-containing protein n=1 Tax=Buddleja alternifolia TaxID=168488 RepID=A0AAV6Y5E6_9LAMI|nr:hypothetical protein BUALT_Bualt01G0029900 [Buddleja alternifolia]